MYERVNVQLFANILQLQLTKFHPSPVAATGHLAWHMTSSHFKMSTCLDTLLRRGVNRFSFGCDHLYVPNAPTLFCFVLHLTFITLFQVLTLFFAPCYYSTNGSAHVPTAFATRARVKFIGRSV